MKLDINKSQLIKREKIIQKLQMDSFLYFSIKIYTFFYYKNTLSPFFIKIYMKIIWILKNIYVKNKLLSKFKYLRSYFYKFGIISWF